MQLEGYDARALRGVGLQCVDQYDAACLMHATSQAQSYLHKKFISFVQAFFEQSQNTFLSLHCHEVAWTSGCMRQIGMLTDNIEQVHPAHGCEHHAPQEARHRARRCQGATWRP